LNASIRIWKTSFFSGKMLEQLRLLLVGQGVDQLADREWFNQPPRFVVVDAFQLPFQLRHALALGEDFAAAFADLLRLGGEQRLALMCAEAVWWRCHRRIITDYLLLAGHPVQHLLAPGRSQAAQPTPGARRGPAGRVVYPAAAAAAA